MEAINLTSEQREIEMLEHARLQTHLLRLILEQQVRVENKDEPDRSEWNPYEYQNFGNAYPHSGAYIDRNLDQLMSFEKRANFLYHGKQYSGMPIEEPDSDKEIYKLQKEYNEKEKLYENKRNK